MIVEDLREAGESGSRNRDRSNNGDKSEERKCHYCREPGHLMRECQKKNRDQAKEGEQKTQMQQIADESREKVARLLARNNARRSRNYK